MYDSWSDADVGRAIRILSRSISVGSACVELAVSERKLRRVFAAKGIGSPSTYLGSQAGGDDGVITVSPEQYARIHEQNMRFGNPDPNELERILVVPDTHVPYEDKKAFQLLLNAGRKFKPHRIVVLGDFADFYSVSAHSKDPARVQQLDEEVRAVNRALDRLDDLGANHKHYIEGNHEFRLARHLRDKAPALFNTISVPSLFRLEERGWTWTPYRQHLKIGHIYYTHECGTSGKFGHVKAGQVFEHSIVIGHTHHLAMSYFGNAVGESHVAMMGGWLGDAAAADYMHAIKSTRDWHLGFTVGYKAPNGTTHLNMVPIVDYTCVVNGELITL